VPPDNTGAESPLGPQAASRGSHEIVSTERSDEEDFMSKQLPAVRRLTLACLVLVMLAQAPPASAVGLERPYKGSCNTVVLPVTPPGVVPQELRIDTDCTLAHLGRTIGVAEQFVTPTGQSGATVTLLIQNTSVLTAANGDQLQASFIGSGLLDLTTGEVTFIGVETYDGGTGRFVQATGSSTLQGDASIVTNRGFFTVNGRIAY